MKLYIGEYQPTNEKYNFYNGEYMLVFGENPKGKWTEVTTEKIGRLTQTEKEWLFQCKLEINSETLEKNKSDYIEIINLILDETQKEIERAKNVAGPISKAQ